MMRKNFINSVKKNNLEEFNAIIAKKSFNPALDKNYAIRFASKKGYLEMVKILLKDPRVDPSDMGNEAVLYAAKNGQTEIVKLLLKDPRVNPSDRYNLAIRYSALNVELREIAQLLWLNNTVRETLERNNKELYDKLMEQDLIKKIDLF